MTNENRIPLIGLIIQIIGLIVLICMIGYFFYYQPALYIKESNELSIRDNPDCDPTTGELKPEVYQEWQKHKWDSERSLAYRDFCKIPATATINNKTYSVYSNQTQKLPKDAIVDNACEFLDHPELTEDDTSNYHKWAEPYPRRCYCSAIGYTDKGRFYACNPSESRTAMMEELFPEWRNKFNEPYEGKTEKK